MKTGSSEWPIFSYLVLYYLPIWSLSMWVSNNLHIQKVYLLKKLFNMILCRLFQIFLTDNHLKSQQSYSLMIQLSIFDLIQLFFHPMTGIMTIFNTLVVDVPYLSKVCSFSGSREWHVCFYNDLDKITHEIMKMTRMTRESMKSTSVWWHVSSRE